MKLKLLAISILLLTAGCDSAIDKARLEEERKANKRFEEKKHILTDDQGKIPPLRMP